MRFADITGQEDLKRHLVQSVDAGRISHAQLFTGQAGAGALALAVAYVQYLCCRHRRGGDSCGECPDCKQIAALAHPDLHLVFPVNKQGKKSGEVMRSDEFLPLFRGLFAERGGYFSAQDWYDRLDLGKTLKGMIAAREADDIIRKLSFKSFEADYKTMLIWLPEAMNEEAAQQDPQDPGGALGKDAFPAGFRAARPPVADDHFAYAGGLRAAHRTRRSGACGPRAGDRRSGESP